MTPAPNEVLVGPAEEVWESTFNVRAFEALKTRDWSIYARSVLSAAEIFRLNDQFPGWRLHQYVEQDPHRLSLKRVWYAVVFTTPEQARAYQNGPVNIPV